MIEVKNGQEVTRSIMKRTAKYTITLDDDPAISKIIESHTGIKSLHFETSKELLEAMGDQQPMAAFIDIHLGFNQNGLDLVPKLRKQWPLCPIIVVTADPSDQNVNDALSAGADDFLRKPINSIELLARLQLRLADRAEKQGKLSLRIRDLTVDSKNSVLRGPSGIKHLSNTELKLITCLFEAKGTVVNKTKLKSQGWEELAVSDNALVRKIHEIRKSIDEVGSQVKLKTVYGEGFLVEMEKAPAKKVSKQGKGKLLVVDDDDVNRELVCKMSKALGYNAVGVASGEAALKSVHTEKFDLVLLDRHLPGLKGDDISEQVRLNPGENQTVPIIIMTAEYLTREKDEELLANVDDELTKPFNFDDLEEIIKRWVKKDHSVDAPHDADSFAQELRIPAVDPLGDLQLSGQGEVIKEIIQLFIEKTPDILNELTIAVNECKTVDTLELGHKLKGRCGNVGIPSMVELAQQIEKNAQKGNWEEAKKTLSLIKAEFADATQALSDKWMHVRAA